MLFDFLEPDLDRRESLRPVLSRRLTYLADRAVQLSGRELISEEGSWRIDMTIATLWLEAAEASAALGIIDETRDYLRNAIERFLSQRLPFGIVLQRTLMAHEKDLASQADGVISAWREYLSHQEGSNGLADADLPPFMNQAFKSAEQRAYFALGEASSLSNVAKDRLNFERAQINLRGLAQTPIGRLRLPLEYYQLTADLVAFTIIKQGDVADSIIERPIRVIGDALLGIYRSVQRARDNTYLWSRLLVPAPLFDFDTAILISGVLTGPQGLERLKTEVNKVVQEDARPYALEFISLVEKIREP